MDRIRIENLEVYAKHGAMPEEQVLGQKFMITVDLWFDTSAAGLSDELAGTIDYAKVCQLINDFMKNHTFKLIESVAEYLARELLLRYDPLLRGVTINIKKPWAPIALPLDNVGVTISRKWHTSYISMGSNMGDKKKYLRDAVAAFKKHKLCRVTKRSSMIETLPYGNKDMDNFINAMIEVKTLLRPTELLLLCHDLETKAGRERKEHWGPRTLDLDIIFYDDEIINLKEPELIIPHYDMHNRMFVLEPLAQIAPAMMHPIYHKTIYSMMEKLKEKTENEK